MSPFKSKSQQRLFFAAATSKKKWKKGKRPNISLEKAKEWEEETPNKKSLPEKVNSKKTVADTMRKLRRK